MSYTDKSAPCTDKSAPCVEFRYYCFYKGITHNGQLFVIVNYLQIV